MTILGVPVARRLRREILECEECGDSHEVPGILASGGFEQAGTREKPRGGKRSPVLRILAIAGMVVLTLALLIGVILLVPRLG